VIAGRYELEALVGEGGMGAVWRARHLQLQSAVALKLMSPAISQQPEALNRFLREARAAARLSSLHVVKVFDFGVDGETPFIAMELLEGESLRARMERQGALSPEVTLWVMRHASRALSKAHAEGIVHRDLKPENLFITQQEDELLKVLDFGVAKLSGTGSGLPTTSTRTGALLGTPFYMSPEQARGIKAVDHRSDIWSLAVIAFECLTGRLPFESAAFGDLVLKICTLPAPVPSALARVPAGFDAWFARAVQREPEQRYATVDEMLAALEVVLGAERDSLALRATVGGGPRAPQSAPLRTDVTAAQSVMAVLPSRRGPRRLWLWGGLAGLIGLGVLGLVVARGGPARPPRGEASAAQARNKPEAEPAGQGQPSAPAEASAGVAAAAEPSPPAAAPPVEPATAPPAEDPVELGATSEPTPAEVPAAPAAEAKPSVRPVPALAFPPAPPAAAAAPAAATVAPRPSPTAHPTRAPAPPRRATPAPPAASPTPAPPPHSDLFSDPD